MPLEPRNVQCFKNPAALRRRFREHHAAAGELRVGFHKRATGWPNAPWPESVDEASSVGWIDGIRKSVDDETYPIRVTPRRKGSVWGRVNIRRIDVRSIMTAKRDETRQSRPQKLISASADRRRLF